MSWTDLSRSLVEISAVGADLGIGYPWVLKHELIGTAEVQVCTFGAGPHLDPIGAAPYTCSNSIIGIGGEKRYLSVTCVQREGDESGWRECDVTTPLTTSIVV